MESRKIVLKFLNFIFWIIVFLIISFEVYNIFQPIIIKSISDKNSIYDVNILNELSQCTNIYLGKIINKQYVKANNLSDFFNQKSNEEYDAIYNKLIKVPNYRIVIKEIYRLSNETYRCYFLINDNTSTSIDYLNKTDKYSMNIIVLKLNTKDTTFNVLYDFFK